MQKIGHRIIHFDMDFTEGYRGLEVYKLSRSLSKKIFELSKGFPREEMYSLTDQIRRSSRSVGGQIAEAWGKRKYERHFVAKLTDADGEQLETQHWLETARDCLYIPGDVCERHISDYNAIGRMLNSMIRKAPSFCKNQTSKRQATTE